MHIFQGKRHMHPSPAAVKMYTYVCVYICVNAFVCVAAAFLYLIQAEGMES